MGKLKHGKWTKYKRIYKYEWEEDPHLRGWVAPVQGMETRALCLVCRTKLRAHKTDLLKHAESQKHKDNMSLYGPTGPDNFPSNPEDGTMHIEVHQPTSTAQVVHIDDPTSATVYTTVQDPSTSEAAASTHANMDNSTKPAETHIITVVTADNNVTKKLVTSQAPITQAANQKPVFSAPHSFVNAGSSSTSTPLYATSRGTCTFVVGRQVPTKIAISEQASASKSNTSDTTGWLLVIEKERLAMEKERLMIEKERLKVESERLALEKERLMIEREHAAGGYSTVVVEAAPTMVSVIDDAMTKTEEGM